MLPQAAHSISSWLPASPGMSSHTRGAKNPTRLAGMPETRSSIRSTQTGDVTIYATRVKLQNSKAAPTRNPGKDAEIAGSGTHHPLPNPQALRDKSRPPKLQAVCHASSQPKAQSMHKRRFNGSRPTFRCRNSSAYADPVSGTRVPSRPCHAHRHSLFVGETCIDRKPRSHTNALSKCRRIDLDPIPPVAWRLLPTSAPRELNIKYSWGTHIGSG